MRVKQWLREFKVISEEVLHIPVENLTEAVELISPMIEEESDINWIVLMDFDRTISKGINAELVRFPFLPYFLHRSQLIPDSNLKAILQLEQVNVGRNGIITNRRDWDPIWLSHKILENLINRLSVVGCEDMPIFQGMDRIKPDFSRDYTKTNRFQNITNWANNIAKNGKPTQIIIVSDRGVDMPTEDIFMFEFQRRIQSPYEVRCTVFDIYGLNI